MIAYSQMIWKILWRRSCSSPAWEVPWAWSCSWMTHLAELCNLPKVGIFRCWNGTTTRATTGSLFVCAKKSRCFFHLWTRFCPLAIDAWERIWCYSDFCLKSSWCWAWKCTLELAFHTLIVPYPVQASCEVAGRVYHWNSSISEKSSVELSSSSLGWFVVGRSLPSVLRNFSFQWFPFLKCQFFSCPSKIAGIACHLGYFS